MKAGTEWVVMLIFRKRELYFSKSKHFPLTTRGIHTDLTSYIFDSC